MKSFIAHLLVTASLLLTGGVAIATDVADISLLAYPEPAGEKCVLPPEQMRREHMDQIKHQRDETMYNGIRGITAKHSLKGCIDCHAGYDNQGKAIPINAEGQFCQSCHNYTAVRIDCFGCHRTTPDGENPMRESAMTNPHQ